MFTMAPGLQEEEYFANVRRQVQQEMVQDMISRMSDKCIKVCQIVLTFI